MNAARYSLAMFLALVFAIAVIRGPWARDIDTEPTALAFVAWLSTCWACAAAIAIVASGWPGAGGDL